jgi:hypothetical protein
MSVPGGLRARRAGEQLFAPRAQAVFAQAVTGAAST